MGLESVHPQYDEFKDDWTMQRDLYKGERAVKAKGEVYLPATPSMLLDGMKKGEIGAKVYDGYLKRAVFPDYIKDAVEILVGMLHHKPPTIELPPVMEPLLEKATLSGESLHMVLRRINTEQLITGRIGVLADMPENPDPANPLPYLATYIAESAGNWDEADDQEGFVALNLVVLNESGLTREANFSWKTFKKYRVLQLGDIQANERDGVYLMGVFDDLGVGNSLSYSQDEMKAPMFRGATLDEIPFVFINTRDLLASPDESPTLGLGKLVLAIYRGEADYRQSLFMTGQDTLVVIGGVKKTPTDGIEDDALRTGAGSRIDIDLGGDAKYVGVNSEGLPEQRTALENDRRRAETKSGQLIQAKSQAESGEALSTRLEAQTATLNQIALTGALGLQTLLRKIAKWMGADPEKVKVTANMEFGEVNLEVSDITELMAARTQGAPISKKSIHQLLVDRRLTKMDYETEMETIKEEDAEMPRVGQGATNVTADEQLAQAEQDRIDKQAADEAKAKKGAPGAK